jgi:hypothetical protein
VGGPAFLAVSFIAFCYLFFFRQSQASKLTDIILKIAESFAISASAFILLFIVARLDRLLRGDWISFVFAFGIMAPHLPISAVSLPLLVLLYRKIPSALVIIVAICIVVLALAIFEPGLRARFS